MSVSVSVSVPVSVSVSLYVYTCENVRCDRMCSRITECVTVFSHTRDRGILIF